MILGRARVKHWIIGGLATLGLAACATYSPETPAPQVIDPAKRAQITIPDELPDLNDPLGILRPDAPQTRDDIKIKVETYRIIESEPDTLLLGPNGIRAALQKRGWDYIARVDWRIRWTYDFDDRGGICAVEDVQTELTVTYALPDWRPSKTPPPGLRAYWEEFETALLVHEYGHAKIGYDAKLDIETALKTANIPDANCQRVAKQLNQMARDIINQELDKTYDAITDHGQTQGATYDVEAARKAVTEYRTGSTS